MLSAEELEQIQARCDAATPGPWNAKTELHISDAAFIAHAREDVPKLLAALREARDDRELIRCNLMNTGDENEALIVERDALREQLAQKERVLEREAAGWAEQVQALRAELNTRVETHRILAEEANTLRAEVERLRESLDNTYSNVDECNDAFRQLAEAKALLIDANHALRIEDDELEQETAQRIAAWLEKNNG